MVEVELKENYSWYEYFGIRLMRNAKEELKLEPDTWENPRDTGCGGVES